MRFSEIMIVRYYESWIIDVTYSDNWSEENKNLIEKNLEKELKEDKHLETYKIFFHWEDIWSLIRSEEERGKYKNP